MTGGAAAAKEWSAQTVAIDWDLRDVALQCGSVNQPRRIEAGMLSWGSDILEDTNALELGLPKFMVNLKKKTPFVGKCPRPPDGWVAGMGGRPRAWGAERGRR